jgi:hypothetical protein
MVKSWKPLSKTVLHNLVGQRAKRQLKNGTLAYGIEISKFCKVYKLIKMFLFETVKMLIL